MNKEPGMKLMIIFALPIIIVLIGWFSMSSISCTRIATKSKSIYNSYLDSFHFSSSSFSSKTPQFYSIINAKAALASIVSAPEPDSSTAWLSVHPSDFEPVYSNSSWTQTQSYIYRQSGQSSYMLAHVRVLDEADVDSFKCDVYDNDSSYKIYVYLYRKTQTWYYLCGSDSSATTSSIQTLGATNGCTSGIQEFINAESGSDYNSYLIRAYITSPSSNIRLYNCAIEFNL